jgi:murein DD-endopeptidase MepM/ murein hydrolase activator NlpD
LGVTGNTGTRTTGEHLHFSVKNIAADGTSRDVDPASYLAEIAQKGNLTQQALHNGNDLLAKYKTNATPAIDTSLSPDEWMKKLLSSEDSSVGLSGNDPVMSMATAMYSGLLMLAVQIDNQNEEEQKAQISESVSNRQLDLKSLVPSMKECQLTIGENGKAVLHANNGTINVAHELSAVEMARLSQVLGNSSLSNEAKEMRVAGMVNTIVLSQQASQNYEQRMAEQEGQAQNLQRK